jgi:asparagine synthase (glutamine-hydrolysing)
MCGICGFYTHQFNPQEQTNLLQQMTGSLAHRGPDGGATWCAEGVGLGHRRLAIIDLSTGDQPMWDIDRQQVIVFNGEIYNYPELKNELIARGYRFETQSDTEIIPAVLREWGLEQGLRKLRGMFAFALYSPQERRLLLARDRVGIKPLYWSKKNGQIYFASEMKALLRPGLVERVIDPVSVHDYLALGFSLAPRTCWRDISLLPPGSWLEVTPEGIKQGLYWQWQARPEYGISEEAWQDELESTFSDSLRAHLLSDVPLGAFLSGGIDSSLVTALLARNHVKDLHTFNVTFDEAGYDESPYARAVAEQYKTIHQEIPVQASASGPELLAQVMTQFDEPFGDTASLPNYLLAQATSQRVKVVLSGDGGDELLGGYPMYRRIRQTEWLSRLQWANPLVNPLLALSRYSEKRFFAKLTKFWDHAQGQTAERLTKQISLYSDFERAARYQPGFADAALAAGPSWTRIAPHIPAQADDPLDRFLTFDLHLRLQAGYLRKVDVTSSAHGLETRVPFLDNTMLELSERIPARLKLKNDQTKYLAYQLARKYLPRQVVERPKHGFNFPFDRWASAPATLDYLRGLLFSRETRWTNFLNSAFLDDPWQVFTGQKQHPHLSREGAYARIYNLTALEIWLRDWNLT